jgi:putative flippase GtrA
MNSKHNRTFIELVKYGLVGVAGDIVDLGIFYLLVEIVEAHYCFSDAVSNFCSDMGYRMRDSSSSDTLVSSFIGQTAGAVNNFLLNAYFTFKVSDRKLLRFIPYLFVFLLGVVVSAFSLTLLIDYCGVADIPAKIVTMVVVAAIQFILNKFIVYRKKA